MNTVTISIGIVLICAVVSFLIWYIASKSNGGKFPWTEFGRITYFAAILVFFFALSGSFLATCSTSGSGATPPAVRTR